MAVSTLGAQLTDWHMGQQQALAARIQNIVMAIFPGLDLSSFAAVDASWPALELGLRAAIEAGYGASSALAVNYYELFRAAEGLSDAFSTVLADPISPDQLGISLKVTGPYVAKHLIAVGDANIEAKLLVSMLGAAGRLTLSGGRESILANGRADKALLGYQRACYGKKPCTFCRMLRSRGPVYHSEQSAEFKGNGERYHDHCHCQAEPVYSTDTEWVPGGREDRDLWNEVTAGVSGKDAIAAFRSALDTGH